MNKKKRLLSCILSAVMALSMFTALPVSAEVGTTEYTYDNYSVEYIVSNEWTGNQSVEVKITNTSDEPILNWAVKYDARGEISGLWSAEAVSNDGSAYLIKNSGYNYEIAPNQTVNFGYTLSGEGLFLPESFELCSKRADVSSENYTAVLNITEEWDTGFKGEIVVSNMSSAPIEAWKLSFDGSFELTDVWNGRLLESENESYTVSSEAWSNPIAPSSSVTIGIVGTKIEEQTVEISNASLSEVVIDNTLPDPEDPENPEDPEDPEDPAEEIVIAAFGEYSAETGTIEVFWISTVSDGTFEILTSYNNSEYTVIGSIDSSDSYSFPADFDKQYIKVKQTKGEVTAESEVFVVTKIPTGYLIDFLDTDDDGIYDYIEDAIGTDKTLADTDSDGLTDYEEVYVLGTDPVVYDSVTSGLSDGDADLDNDGLSNRYELDNGTNPLYDDTDNDGLKDGEEVNSYGTDPLKYDTDEDNIGDGDETALGLDPINASTDGTPDSERLFEQEISSDSEIMSEINTADNAFDMSIDITAAGNAENSMSVGESGYSEVMQNDAILGTIPEISYTDGLSVGEVTVKFEIKDSYTDNVLGTYADECEELEGIKRLNIFRYFEEENVLLPVETFHDTATNTVYTTTDCTGTYCLMDMEKFLESLNSEPIENVEFESGNDFEYFKPVEFKAAPVSQVTAQVDVVFLLQSEGVEAATFASQKQMIASASDMLIAKYPNVNISIVTYGLNGAEVRTLTEEEAEGKTALEKIQLILDNISYTETYEYCKRDAAISLAMNTTSGCFRSTTPNTNKYAFQVLNGATNVTSDITNSIALNNINYSIIWPDEYIYEDTEYGEILSALITKTKGETFVFGENTATEVYEHVDCGNQNFNIISSAGLTRIKLDKPITEEAKKAVDVYIDEEKSEKSSKKVKELCADTDSDELYDIEEILFATDDRTLISFDSNGDMVLKTFLEYRKMYSGLYYVEDGLKRFENQSGAEYFNTLNTVLILPIKSDPTKEDSDGDGLLDGKAHMKGNKAIAPPDPNPLKVDGPKGMWLEHIRTAQSDDVPTELDGWYGYTQPIIEQPNYGAEGLFAFVGELNYLEENGMLVLSPTDKAEVIGYALTCFSNTLIGMDEMGTKTVGVTDTSEDGFHYKAAKGSFNKTMQIINDGITEGADEKKILASLGSRALNFKADSKGNIHSRHNTWQAIGGYNNIYDKVFREYTNYNMRNEKFSFTVEENETEYILWIWRGDYLNLGPGSEIGLYYRPSILSGDPSGLDQYYTYTELAVPMQMYLYNYENSSNIENILAWNPDEDQWWITGFNPDYLRDEVDVKKQVMISSVDFTGREDMYAELKRLYQSGNKLSKSTVFDDNKHIMWLCWYEEDLL